MLLSCSVTWLAFSRPLPQQCRVPSLYATFLVVSEGENLEFSRTGLPKATKGASREAMMWLAKACCTQSPQVMESSVSHLIRKESCISAEERNGPHTCTCLLIDPKMEAKKKNVKRRDSGSFPRSFAVVPPVTS